MIIEVDQSGKMEQTEKPTVLACSHSKDANLILRAKEKRDLQEIFRLSGIPKVFVTQTFAVLIYFLIKEYYFEGAKFKIDIEYAGYEEKIREYVWQLIVKNDPKLKSKINFSFGSVGKSSWAHKFASRVYETKKSVRVVMKEEVLSQLLLLENKPEVKK